MSRLVFAAFFVIGPLFVFAQRADAEVPEGKAIHDVLDGGVAALFDSDFPRLVSLLHPSTQRLFRDQLSANFDQLLRVYSFEQISAVSGLPQHPKDLKLSDPEFFVLACEQERARHPDFVGDPKYLPFDIREVVYHGDNLVNVTLSYTGHVQTERTDYWYLRPFVIVLQRESSRWQILSCPLAHAITCNWSRDLAYAPARTR